MQLAENLFSVVTFVGVVSYFEETIMESSCKIGMVALMASIPFKLRANTFAHDYEFDANVISVNDFGLLNIEGIGFARLIPGGGFVEFAEEKLIGKRIKCDEAGDTFTYKLREFDDVRRTVSCAADLLGSVGFAAEFENRSQTLQEFLIDIGVAKEFRAETFGLFGHCDQPLEQ